MDSHKCGCGWEPREDSKNRGASLRMHVRKWCKGAARPDVIVPNPKQPAKVHRGYKPQYQHGRIVYVAR